MRKVIALGLLLAALSPMGVSALTATPADKGWMTVSGSVSFVDLNDSLVVEYNGMEIIRMQPQCDWYWQVGKRINPCELKYLSVSDGNGWTESTILQEKDFSFDFNLNSGNFGVYSISKGIKTKLW